MTAVVVRGNALRLPLPDNSVDLIVTSPPYFQLRLYTDGGQHYAGQVGSEATPAEYVATLVAATRECLRVLKPQGSMFVDLGDKYSGVGGSNDHGWCIDSDSTRDRRAKTRVPLHNKGRTSIAPAKSLMLLPERYRIACVDELGVIVRKVIVWDKPNGLPESVTDRVRSSHEDWVHLVKSPRYFSAVDEIREPHSQHTTRYYAPGVRSEPRGGKNEQRRQDAVWHADPSGQGLNAVNPLGKLPGSVWTIPTEPLTLPEFRIVGRPGLRWIMDQEGAWKWCRHHGVYSSAVPRDDSREELRAAPDHFAAFPSEWPRRLILGWSPSGVCVQCGEGRRPVSVREHILTQRVGAEKVRPGLNNRHLTEDRSRRRVEVGITGYACACTPFTDYPERRRPTVTPGRELGRGHQQQDARAAVAGSRHHGNDWPERQPTREYHFDRWTPPATRPAVVLDPFGGTGTTAMVASALGRIGVTVDLSWDYTTASAWRVTDPKGRAKVRRRTHRDAQADLFEAGAG